MPAPPSYLPLPIILSSWRRSLEPSRCRSGWLVFLLLRYNRSVKKAIVTLYTRPGCHLCDDAKANIFAAGCSDQFQLVEVNIDEDAEARARYQYDIPVIFINGVKVFKHRVEPRDFKRKLRRLLRDEEVKR